MHLMCSVLSHIISTKGLYLCCCLPSSVSSPFLLEQSDVCFFPDPQWTQEIYMIGNISSISLPFFWN